MNPTTIARYYPAYLDALRTWGRQPERSLLSLFENVLRAELLLAEPGRRFSISLNDQENPTQRFDHLGMLTTDALAEFVPARVANWVQLQLQLLALPAGVEPGTELWATFPTTGWLAKLHAFTPTPQGLPGQPAPAAVERQPSLYLTRQGSAAALAQLTRGLRTYQAKRRKQARRLLAQLWAYHWQQGQQQIVAVGGQEGGRHA